MFDILNMLPSSIIKFLPAIIAAGGVYIGQRMKDESLEQLGKKAEIGKINNEIRKTDLEEARLMQRRVKISIIEQENSTCTCNSSSVEIGQ